MTDETENAIQLALKLNGELLDLLRRIVDEETRAVAIREAGDMIETYESMRRSRQ
jgi:hypothetical protein